MGKRSTVGGSILLVANYPSNVGYAWTFIERLWCELADVWHSAGRACYLAYPCAGPVPATVRDAGIVPVVADLSARSLSGLRQWTKVIRQARIRVVYLTDRRFHDPAYALVRAAGVRAIVNHDHTPGDRPPVRGVLGAVKSVVNRTSPFACDWWVVPSPLIKTRAQENGRIPGSRCVVVQNGIESLERGAHVRRSARAMLGLSEQEVAVVTTGRATRYKGLDHIIRVAARMKKDDANANVRFVHIGDGPELSSLQEMARSLGLDNSEFRFEGRRSDVRSLLPGCDIGIHAAKGEGFSLSVLEYMSAGLATVVPDVPTVSQAIDDGRTGIVYRSGSVEDAAGAIRNLVNDPGKRMLLGSAAADEVHRRFSWERTRRELRAAARRWLDS